MATENVKHIAQMVVEGLTDQAVDLADLLAGNSDVAIQDIVPAGVVDKEEYLAEQIEVVERQAEAVKDGLIESEKAGIVSVLDYLDHDLEANAKRLGVVDNILWSYEEGSDEWQDAQVERLRLNMQALFLQMAKYSLISD